MFDSAHKRSDMVGFLAVLALSAATMLWFFWRHPVTTAIVTIIVLAAFAVSARLAQLVDDLSDIKPPERARSR